MPRQASGDPELRVVAVVLAAGRGTRFGHDKTLIPLAGKPLWRHAFDTLHAHPKIDAVGLIGSPQNLDVLRTETRALFVEVGGDTRTESSRRAAELAQGGVVLIHDAARPFVTAGVIDRVVDALADHPAVAPAVPVVDTIRWVSASGTKTPPRSELFAMQTPQGAHRNALLAAYSKSTGEFTDEMALMESVGITPKLVEGDPRNFKVTTPDDYAHALRLMGEGETRTGFGYDIHAFATGGRPLVLGGVPLEGPGLDGHSDADVILHAATDALLGAAAMGDIGQHFPNTDPRWRGESSVTFLRHAAQLLRDEGWTLVNLDVTVLAEAPKVMPHAAAMQVTISTALGIETSRVSIKATTNEGLGAIGRKEGIAAMATATIRR